MTRLGVVRLMACLLLCAGPALAQEDPARDQARVLYENGATLYEEGEYEKAIVAWEQAYALSKEPALLYNIANALERLGRIGPAIDRLNEYRIYAPAEERETLERRLRALERRLQEEQAPAPVVEPPAPDPAPPPTPPPPAPQPPAKHPLRAAGVVLGAVGLGGAGAGAGLYASASRQAELALGSCAAVSAGWLCADEAAAPADRSRALATGGHVSWAVAGALLVSGAVTLALDATSTRVLLTPVPVRGGAGIFLQVPL